MKMFRNVGLAIALLTSGFIFGQESYYGGLTVPETYNITFEGATNSINAASNVLNLNGATTITGALTTSNALSVYSLHKLSNTGIGFGITTPAALLHINMGTGTATYKNTNMFALTTNGVKGSFFFGNTLATHGYAWSYDPTNGKTLVLDEMNNGAVLSNILKIGTTVDVLKPLNASTINTRNVSLLSSGNPNSVNLSTDGMSVSHSYSNGLSSNTISHYSSIIESQTLFQGSYVDPRKTELYSGKIVLTGNDITTSLPANPYTISMDNGVISSTYNNSTSKSNSLYSYNAITMNGSDLAGTVESNPRKTEITPGVLKITNNNIPSLIANKDGNVSIGTETVYGGTSNPYKLTVNGKFACTDLMVDAGASTFTGAVQAKSTLGVTGVSTLSGAVNAGNTLSVVGLSTLNGAVLAKSTLGVTGVSTLSGAVNAGNTLSVAGVSTLSGAVQANSTLGVTGVSTLSGAVNAGSTLSVAGVSTLNGAVLAKSTLGVTGISTLSGAVNAGSTLSVVGLSTFNGAVQANSTLAVAGASTFTGAVQAYSTLSVAGVSNFGSLMSVNNGLTVNNASKVRLDGSSTFSMNGSGTFAIDANGIVGGRFLVNTDGSVCIGCTDTKGYKLGVNGSLAAKSIDVRVDLWADYVFDKNYKLPSLYDVEKHITQYKHLPDVPSEADVKASGINVAKMDALLMQKIEENTLYLIDLQKQNDVAKQELAQVKKQNELLQQQLLVLQQLLQTQKQ